LRFAKQSQFNPQPWKCVEYGELLIMPANGTQDLIRRLKVNPLSYILYESTA
jgi:hypothetical protein